MEFAVFSITALQQLSEMPKSEQLHVQRMVSELTRGAANLNIEPIQKHPGLFRLRAGNYRILFRHQQPPVVYEVRKRSNTTYKLLPKVGSEGRLDGIESVELNLEETEDLDPATQQLTVYLQESDLRAWGVDDAFIPAFMRCQNDDDFLALSQHGVPEELISKVLDKAFPPPIDQTLHKPKYLVSSEEELQSYLEGRLTDLLLVLDPEQQEAASWRLQGPALVRGGPGTGKTVVAIYRVLELAKRFPQAQILHATYNKTLSRYAQQLLNRLFEQRSLQAQLTVSTADALLPAQARGQLVDGASLENLTGQAMQQLNHPLLNRLGKTYVQDELDLIIEGWGLDQESYLGFARSGRKLALSAADRLVLWQCYETRKALLQSRGLRTWNQARQAAVAMAQPTFDYVIVDETQDLSPVALRFLLRLAKDASGVYLTADANQSLYQRGFSFSMVDSELNMRGRSLLLRQSYRSTAPIHAALSNLSRFPGFDPTQSLPPQKAGPKPLVLRLRRGATHAPVLAEYVRKLCHDLRLPFSAVAMLTPNQHSAKALANELSQLGLKASFSQGESIELDAKTIKCLTLYSAKGLEFPIVFVLDVSQGVLPNLATVPREEIANYMGEARKLLYVGCSRAMQALVITTDARKPSVLLSELGNAVEAKDL